MYSCIQAMRSHLMPSCQRNILPITFVKTTHQSANIYHQLTPAKVCHYLPKITLLRNIKQTMSTFKYNSKENIYTIPNLLTISRIIATPFIGYLIVTHNLPLALGALAVAGTTDILDGYIARKFNQKTFLGSALDPAADKILMTTLTVSLCTSGLLSVPLAGLIIGRDVFLTIGAMFYRYQSLPSPKTWKRYWDITLPSVEVNPPMISKVNTALQLGLMGASLASPVFGIPYDNVMLEMLRWTVAGTTIASGGAYVFGKDVVKFIKKR